MTVTVTAKELKAALLFCSTDKTRIALAGVRIVAKKGKVPLIIATDGRRFVAIRHGHDSCDYDCAITVEAGALRNFLALKRPSGASEGGFIIIKAAEKKNFATFSTGDGENDISMTSKFVCEQDFPNFKQLLSSRKGGSRSESMNINAELLTSFAQAAKILDIIGKTMIVWQDDELGVADIRFSGTDYFFGMLMPMAVPGSKPSRLPEWIQEGTQ